MDIGQRIKLRREELGIGQRELAEKLGYKNNSTLSGIESGKVDLTQSRITAIAKALDVTPGWLMGWEEEKPAETSELSEKQKKVVQMIMEIPEERLDWVYSVLQTILAGGQ